MIAHSVAQHSSKILAPEYAVAELHAAGFRVERLEGAFSRNPATKEMNWIIVAVPGTRSVSKASEREPSL